MEKDRNTEIDLRIMGSPVRSFERVGLTKITMRRPDPLSTKDIRDIWEGTLRSLETIMYNGSMAMTGRDFMMPRPGRDTLPIIFIVEVQSQAIKYVAASDPIREYPLREKEVIKDKPNTNNLTLLL